ncbi:MAG: glycosyltransferase family 2 protein [Candidatus Omnitrophica bacterium]|nr:glycosyltransferase family 2 protein [Candidatus Omnitrophota bacterium]
MLVSVVVPVYNEAENVPLLLEQVQAALAAVPWEYEIIVVDDGSTDTTMARLRECAGSRPGLKVVSLVRNFGQTAALVCGITMAAGEIIVLSDGDLQNDPRDIPALVAKMQEGYDVVSGWRKDRKDPFFSRRLPSLAANKLISWISGLALHDYGCTLKAYRAPFLKSIQLYGEMHRFIPMYAASLGARITELPVNHRPRLYGRSKYTLARVGKVILDLITVKFLFGYQTKPIYIFGGTGLLAFFCGGIFLAMLLYNKFVLGISMIQSPLLLMSGLAVVIGVQFILMGLLAEVQIRSYHESAHKSIYAVRELING